jgi:hypothetical protein
MTRKPLFIVRGNDKDVAYLHDLDEAIREAYKASLSNSRLIEVVDYEDGVSIIYFVDGLEYRSEEDAYQAHIQEEFLEFVSVRS